MSSHQHSFNGDPPLTTSEWTAERSSDIRTPHPVQPINRARRRAGKGPGWLLHLPSQDTAPRSA